MPQLHIWFALFYEFWKSIYTTDIFAGDKNTGHAIYMFSLVFQSTLHVSSLSFVQWSNLYLDIQKPQACLAMSKLQFCLQMSVLFFSFSAPNYCRRVHVSWASLLWIESTTTSISKRIIESSDVCCLKQDQWFSMLLSLLSFLSIKDWESLYILCLWKTQDTTRDQRCTISKYRCRARCPVFTFADFYYVAKTFLLTINLLLASSSNGYHLLLHISSFKMV